MNFEYAAFLFDSTIIGYESDWQVHGVVSFVGNPLYISAYAKDAMDKFDFSGDNTNDFKAWLSIPQNEVAFAPFMIKFYEDVSNLGLMTYFVEKDYSAFIYLIGLMCNINTIDADSRNSIDVLYRAYKSEYDGVIVNNSTDETIKAFNEHIRHIIQTQRGNRPFQNLLKEGFRSLDDQLMVANLLNENNHDGFMLADYYFYSKQIISTYMDKEVHNVFSTKDTALRFEEMTGRLFKSVNLTVCGSHPDDEFKSVLRFARVVMMFCHYFIEKIMEIKDINTLSEDEKYLFVLIWMILQSGDSNLFINSYSYDHIDKLFLSIKTEVNA